MDIKKVITNLVNALGNQEYSFNEALHSDAFIERYNFETGAKKVMLDTLQAINKHIVSYDHIDKRAFDSDFHRFQLSVEESMLFAWGYKSGSLCIIGIMYADNLSDGEIKALFSRFDDGVTNIMRNHTGRVSGGNNAGTYGTMMLVFSNPDKAKRFNNSIRDYYNSYFFKATYISSMSIDCSSKTLTQGKAPLGGDWKYGLDIPLLRSQLFE